MWETLLRMRRSSIKTPSSNWHNTIAAMGFTIVFMAFERAETKTPWNRTNTVWIGMKKI